MNTRLSSPCSQHGWALEHSWFGGDPVQSQFVRSSAEVRGGGACWVPLSGASDVLSRLLAWLLFPLSLLGMARLALRMPAPAQVETCATPSALPTPCGH